MSEVKPVNFLDLSYPKLVAMLEQLESELVAVEAGDGDRTREVLRNLGDVEDSIAMLRGSIRKFVHSRLYPEIRIEDPEASSDEPAAPVVVALSSWEDKAHILDESIAAFKAGLGVTKADELAEQFSLARDLMPLLQSRGVEVSYERIKGGFAQLTIASKDFLQADGAPHQRMMKLWSKIVRYLAEILPETTNDDKMG